MPASRWTPPAFLLPAWSESRLSLLRQTASSSGPAPLSAAYHTENPKEEAHYTRRQRARRNLPDIEDAATAVFRSQNPFPPRNDQGQRIFRDSDKEGIPKSQRVHKAAPFRSIRKLNSLGESAQQTQEKVHAILRARKTLEYEDGKKKLSDAARRKKGHRSLHLGNAGSEPDYMRRGVGEQLDYQPQSDPTSRLGDSSYAADGGVYVPLTSNFRRRGVRGEFRSPKPIDEPVFAKYKTGLEDAVPADSSQPSEAQPQPKQPSLWGELFGPEVPLGRATANDANDVADSPKGSYHAVPLAPGSVKELQHSSLAKVLNADGVFPQYNIDSSIPPGSLSRDELLDISELANDLDGYLKPENADEVDETTSNEPWARSREDEKQFAALIVRTHDHNLDREDFMRVAARGKHFPGWQDHGAPLRIVPGVDLKTLRRSSYYVLVFRTMVDLESYVKNAEGLHRAAMPAGHEPVELVPGQFLDIPQLEHTDMDMLRNEYAISADGEPLSLQVARYPFPVSIRALLNKPEIAVHRKNRSTVLLWLDGYRPSQTDIQDALRGDGEERGLYWTAIDHITRYKPNLDQAKQVNIVDGEETEENGYIVDDEALNRDSLSRWFLAFEDETEARRFVRLWHKTEWPQAWDLRRHKEEGESAEGAEVIVNAVIFG